MMEYIFQLLVQKVEMTSGVISEIQVTPLSGTRASPDILVKRLGNFCPPPGGGGLLGPPYPRCDLSDGGSSSTPPQPQLLTPGIPPSSDISTNILALYHSSASHTPAPISYQACVMAGNTCSPSSSYFS